MKTVARPLFGGPEFVDERINLFLCAVAGMKPGGEAPGALPKLAEVRQILGELGRSQESGWRGKIEGQERLLSRIGSHGHSFLKRVNGIPL